MASNAEQKHPFHMVSPSPWPLVGTISALALAIGLVMFVHDNGPWLLAAGFALLIFTFYGWWRDVTLEAEVQNHHTAEVQHGLRMGMLLFIASEVMFFFAFFWAYFHAAIPFLSKVASPTWPPEGIVPLHTWTLPFLNTLILLTSGATLTWAHHALREGNRKHLIQGLFLTVALGIIFLCIQAYEYGIATFALTDGIFPSTFYLATGFHGFHVFVGACFLIVCLFRAMKGHFTAKQHVGFEAAAWYWHFVDVVWLFLFICVYWWGGSGYEHP